MGVGSKDSSASTATTTTSQTANQQVGVSGQYALGIGAGSTTGNINISTNDLDVLRLGQQSLREMLASGNTVLGQARGIATDALNSNASALFRAQDIANTATLSGQNVSLAGLSAAQNVSLAPLLAQRGTTEAALAANRTSLEIARDIGLGVSAGARDVSLSAINSNRYVSEASIFAAQKLGVDALATVQSNNTTNSSVVLAALETAGRVALTATPRNNPDALGLEQARLTAANQKTLIIVASVAGLLVVGFIFFRT